MKQIEFVKSVNRLTALPKLRLPELILCGRSNVGKSSFINSIFNRKKLAKVSSYPGKTRTLNYYKVDESYYLVDLPGFGYAKVSKTERENWSKLIVAYLQTNEHINYAIHFVDSRHRPTELDVMLNDLLRRLDIPYMILLTKADKLKQREKSLKKSEITEFFPELIFGENLFFFSSVKGIGNKEVNKKLSNIFA